jgi:hypothetical protein
MKRVFLCLLFVVVTAHAHAHWQQHVDTRIAVSLDDKKHFLNGYETITYTNNSPDTLQFLYIHLWPNAYKHDHTAFAEQQVSHGKTDFYYSKEEDKGYIDSLQFSIDDNIVDYYVSDDNPDIARIEPAHPLLPGASIQIKTPFRVKLPKVYSRLGHTGQAYYISQWYPKPAVYDQYGWHPLPYLDQGEFYAEIGAFDVTITLPDNYIVMATGNCENEAENVWLDQLSKQEAPSDTLYKKSWPRSSEHLKTLHFTENNVHDFAWFADKRWIVRKDTISGAGNQGVTTVYTAFLPEHSKQWKKGNDLLKTTINHYGAWLGKYPYKTMKAVEGDMYAGGGMEYPTITVIDKTSASLLSTVMVHEAGHNWLQGMLASNERDQPWMDEGINTFYEEKTLSALHIADNDDLENISYFQSVAMNEDQPIAQTSTAFTTTNFGGVVYHKTAMMLHWLEAFMGADNFEKGMHEYFNTWQYKHPYPEDLQAILQKYTPQSIDWFFNGGLHNNRKIDFAIKSLRNTHGTLKATIRNKSNFALPIKINAYKKDSLVGSTWTAPFCGDTVLSLNDWKGWDRLQLSDNYADIKKGNDYYNRYGLIHKNGIKLKGFTTIYPSNKNPIFLAPSLGYNVYDGFGLGLLLHNLTWPQNRLQFALAPMYSFKSQTINGTGAISYSWYPRNAFKEIRIQTELKSFSNNQSDLNITNTLYTRYTKVAPSIQFVFKENNPLSTVTRCLTLKAYNISEESFVYTQSPTDSLYRPSSKTTTQNVYGLLRYEHINERTFHPFRYSFEAQMGKNFAKMALEGSIRINYDVKNKSLYLRGFAGKFINLNSSADNSRYYLNTTFSGSNDYLYDGTYLGRNEQGGLSSRQISMQEGGFKIPTPYYANPLGRSDDWLLALNIKTDLPLGKIPLRIYLDIGSFADAKNLNPEGTKISYVGGLELDLFKDAFSIYAPLVMSDDYSNYLTQDFGGGKGSSKFLRGITFSWNIQNVNWLRLPATAFKRIAQ